MTTNSPIAWLRDLDGTGSLHPCAEGDRGAIAVYSEERVTELERALRPFALCAAIFDFRSATRPTEDGDGLISWNDHRVDGERKITVGDLRAARSALTKGE